MIMMNKAKYLSLLVLLGAWGCTTSNYVSNSGGGYDDLYGGSPGGGVVTRDRNIDQDLSRSDNPDYRSTQEDAAGTSDYYDDSYLSSRSVGRQLSPTDVGYNAGFNDGYNLATRSSSPYMGGLGSYWPGSSMNMGFGMSLGSMFRMRPYLGLGFGMGSMMGYGYSPFGYGSMMGYNAFGFDPFGYNSFGYSPYGYGSMYGYGMYDSYYGGYGSGYGYNPWAYSRPVIVVNNNYDRQGLARTYGPRVANGNTRSSDRYNSGFVNSPRTSSNGSDRGARRSFNSGVDAYSAPRSSRSYNRGDVANTGGRTSSDGNVRNYSRGSASGEGNNVYYSRPRSSSASNYSIDNNAGTGNYSAPRSSRSNNTYNSPSYNTPSRSQSDYSSPSRSTNSYSSPRNSDSYSAPARTYSQPSQPSYSAPARSYSAPSGGGGGGGHSAPSRGPR